VNLLSAILILGIIELVIYMLVNYLRRDFQWLVTKKDEEPPLDRKGLDKFFNISYDPYLGWTRRPNTEGIEKGESGEVRYHIDKYGSRRNNICSDRLPTIACFGDSYAFCRQVEDTETWQHYLSESLDTCVLNFGVGNYGLDQALLRYKGSELPESVNTVIMAFVPETICRIQSQWKHYLEFGNTFAFKPRYILKGNGELDLIANPMQSRSDFDNYSKFLPQLQRVDRFYQDKFRKFQFRFPYSISFLRNPIRNFNIMSLLLKREFLRKTGRPTPRAEDSPFEYIMKENIRIAHRLYHDEESVKLFTTILNEFLNLAANRNHRALILVLPQLIDIRMMRNKKTVPYPPILAGLELPDGTMLDFTPHFFNVTDIENYYINDKYGGHISDRGNKYVAKELARIITD